LKVQQTLSIPKECWAFSHWYLHSEKHRLERGLGKALACGSPIRAQLRQIKQKSLGELVTFVTLEIRQCHRSAKELSNRMSSLLGVICLAPDRKAQQQPSGRQSGVEPLQAKDFRLGCCRGASVGMNA